jgi:hypothetical protein
MYSITGVIKRYILEYTDIFPLRIAILYIGNHHQIIRNGKRPGKFWVNLQLQLHLKVVGNGICLGQW